MALYYTCVDCGERREGKAVRCRKCRTTFYRKTNPSSKDRLRNWHLYTKYGITLEVFEGYWYAQQGKCLICRINMKRPTKTKGQALDVVAVDHDHRTGKFRALLCNRCNKGLGMFKDDPKLLTVAIRYLSHG